MQASMTHPSALTWPPANTLTPMAKHLDEMALKRGWKPVSAATRLQRAERLREALCGVPFYAKRAEKARLAGDEMAYWLDLQGSEATLVRPPTKSSTAEAPMEPTSPSTSSDLKG